MNKFFVYNNGDKVTKTYTVSNGLVSQTGVSVKFTVPSGLAISKTNLGKGTFDIPSKTWTIGTLSQNEIVTAFITYVVTNINFAPYDVQSQISSVEGGAFCEGHIYIEKSQSPCVDCDKVYPIFPAFSADNGSYTAKTLNLLDTNISFSTTQSGTQQGIIGYYEPPKIYAGLNYNTLGDLSFVDSNGISFGISGTAITASLVLSSQFPQVVSGSNGSYNFQTLNFGNLNGISFYTSNNSIVASVSTSNSMAYNTIQFTNNTIVSSSGSYNNNINFKLLGDISGGYSGSSVLLSVQPHYLQGTNGDIIFSNDNGITFGGNLSTITASHNGLTSQSNQAFSGSNGSSTFQTLSFGNLNGISHYISNGSLVASYTVPSGAVYSVQAPGSTYTNSVQFNNANGVSFSGGPGGISASIASQFISTVANSNGVTLGATLGVLTASVNQSLNIYAVGNSTDSSSGNVDARSLSIRGLGNISIGYSNGSLEISGPSDNISVSMHPNQVMPSVLVSNNTSLQYMYPLQLDNNLIFNEINLPANFIASSASYSSWNVFSLAPVLSTVPSKTGVIYYNLYTLTQSTLNLYRSAKFEYKVNLSGSSGYNGDYLHSYYTNLQSTIHYNGSSVTGSNVASSTAIYLGSITATTITANYSAITGLGIVPIIKNLGAISLSKGVYYAALQENHQSSNLLFNSIGFNYVNTNTVINAMEFGNFTNANLYAIQPLNGIISGATATSYNVTRVSTATNQSILIPSINFLNRV